MQRLDNQNLEAITGGASPWIALGIVATIVFISGVIEGIVHPKGCDAT